MTEHYIVDEVKKNRCIEFLPVYIDLYRMHNLQEHEIHRQVILQALDHILTKTDGNKIKVND